MEKTVAEETVVERLLLKRSANEKMVKKKLEVD